MTQYIYFKATGELLNKIEEIQEQARDVNDQAQKIAISVGGASPVMSGSSMVGVYFPDGKPDDTWAKVKGSSNYDKFFRPLITKGHRDLANKMKAIKKPSWSDILKLIDLDGHMILGKPAAGQRGFPMLRPSGEEVGGETIIKVPVGSGEESVIGESSYKGHELLWPITEAEYYRMKADALEEAV